MRAKLLSLTTDELLTVVKSEALQLDSWGKEKVVFIVSKKVNYENGEEYLSVEVLKEGKND